MYKNALIDWIAATIPRQFQNAYTAARYAEGLFPTPHDTYVLTKPLHGYRVAIVEPYGIMLMTGASEKMGTHVILSGSTLNKLHEDGFTRIDALKNLITAGASLSRFDVALDVHEGSVRPQDLYHALKNGRATSKARNYRLMEGSDGGSTVYLGSPQSEKMMRMYDKGVESGNPLMNWKRIELQLAGGLANRAAKAVIENGVGAVVTRLITDMISWDIGDWKSIVTGEIADIVASSRKLTNTKKWLLDVVAGVVAEMSLTDNQFPTEFWERVASEIEQRQARKLKD